MAISSYKVELFSSANGTSYTQLLPIKEFPDIGSAPEALETTTTSDAMQTHIEGIISLDSLEFKANYDKETYKAIAALKGKTQYFQIRMGDNGANGVFSFQGTVSATVSGASVNEVVEMTVTVVPSTEITFAESVGA